MARPGQREKRKAYAEKQEASNGERTSGPVLPVAELPADFAGDPEDGATYLALVNREATALPPYKRAPRPAPAPPARAPAAQPIASSSRHPALPNDSWPVTFEAHFLAFRKRAHESVERRPRPPGTPQPSSRAAWLAYLNGKRAESASGGGLDDGEGGVGADDDGEEEEEEEEDMDMDDDADDADEEEAYINTHGAAPAAIVPEPDPAILASLTSTEAALIISHITSLLVDRTAALPPPPPSPSSSTSPRTRTPRPAAPLTRALAHHLFALLLRLDALLPSDALSTLRQLARTCAEVARWRWAWALPLPLPPPSPSALPAPGSALPLESAAAAQTCSGTAQAAGYEVGLGWKAARDSLARSDVPPPPEHTAPEDALDDVLARCWLVAYAVVAGWAQRDLADEFERAFRRVPVA
ncbi:hypothetical protein Q5752_005693 [Cryptotrichosporon argae]